MRYVAAAFIITLGACSEAARRALGPTGDSSGRDAAPIAVDTVIDYAVHRGAAPTLLSRSTPRLPKAPGPHNGPGVVAMSFVIDTAGFVIRNSIRIETPAAGEFG